jgi:ribosomal subunit interface protein
MNVKIFAKNIELIPSIQEYIENKVKTLEKLSPSIRNIKVNIEINRKHQKGDIFTCDILLEFPKKKLYASETTEDLRAAVDLVVPKIKRQLEDYLAKIEDSKKQLS